MVIAPDKFAGSLSAPDVTAALHRGWRDIRPGDQVVEVPLSDGGPGFIDCLAAGRPGRMESVTVTGPMGISTPARMFVSGSDWYLESAQACGLHLVDPPDRNPMQATTYGVGELMQTAVAEGATRLVIGLGGSATNDAGAGMLAALGAEGHDAVGDPVDLARGPDAWVQVASVGLATARSAVASVRLVIATDVDSPLLGPEGASRMFGPQKGATPDVVDRLESLLGAFARACAGTRMADEAGAGAAGGLGFGLMLLGGRRESGIDLITSATGLAERCREADVVITGEGRIDEQSLRGKVVSGVVAAARPVPVFVVAGQSTLASEAVAGAGIRQVDTLLARASGPAEAIANAAELLRAVARDLARSVS